MSDSKGSRSNSGRLLEARIVTAGFSTVQAGPNENDRCMSEPDALDARGFPRLALKYGKHFLVTDEDGMIPRFNKGGYGYYCGLSIKA